MSVGGGRKGRVQPEMNVTPLVDVVLVLLIIFMILAPIITQAFAVRLPPKDDDKQEELDQANDPNQPLVLTVTDEQTFEVNGVTIDEPELSVRLHRMFNARPDNVIYIDGEDDAAVGTVLHGVDLARQGGASPVVFLTKKLQ
ncbi:ExbD/TolR family protein [Paraliomyxa miuraensis]|uniref:ExbD/TolR family protein n=1 Tax=Paraliomyxa miuraensis TaxID=376150 RepID=UPI0022594FE9|nr:biopolymer transporter ExbD [Paraliomyxa miuraensis]MCX4241247.1 biopolymer transporter ExbD [Paraliomyxa miuraensis]